MQPTLSNISSHLAEGHDLSTAAFLAAVGDYASLPRHSAEENRRFAALVTGLLPAIDASSRRAAAALLSAVKDVPAEVWSSFASLRRPSAPVGPVSPDLPHLTPAPVEMPSPNLSPSSVTVFEALLDGTGSPQPYRGELVEADLDWVDRAGGGRAPAAPVPVQSPASAVFPTGRPAGRPAPVFDLLMVACLVEQDDYAGIIVMLRAERSRLSQPMIDRLLALAERHAGLADALAERSEVEDSDLLRLFFVLGRRSRRRVTGALELLALKDLMHNRVSTVRFTLPVMDHLALERSVPAAENGDATRLIDLLARHLGLSSRMVESMVLDRGGEPLVYALRAIGLSASLAIRILQFADRLTGRSGDPLRDASALIQIFEGLSPRAAQIAIESWGGPAQDQAQAQPYARRQTPIAATVIPPARPSHQAEPVAAVTRLAGNQP